MTPINHTHADSHHRFESQLWDSSSASGCFLYSTFLFTSPPPPSSPWSARAAGESHTAAPRPVRRQGGAWRRGPKVGHTPEDGRPATAVIRRLQRATVSPATGCFPAPIPRSPNPPALRGGLALWRRWGGSREQ